MALISKLMVRIGADPDGVKRGVRKAKRELRSLALDAKFLTKRFASSGLAAGRQYGKKLTDGIRGFVGDKLKNIGKALLEFAPRLAAVGSAAITLAPLLAQAAIGIAHVVSAAISAAPALIALGAGALIVKTAFTQMFAEGTAARKALAPLGAMLIKARDAGSQAAAKGIKPLADALRKVAQPVVTRFMVNLGKAANRAQKTFLKWAKSTEGVKALRNILEPLSAAVTKLAPHVAYLAVAVARLLGRIMGVTMAAGSRGLAGAIDWLSDRLDKVNADSVTGGLSRLAHTARSVISVVRTVAGWVRKLAEAYHTYTTQFRLVADALSVVAIVFGGPITAAIAAAGLIIRHFDQIKAAWSRLKAAFSGGGGAGPIASAFANLKAAVGIVVPALVNAGKQIWAAMVPKLREIWSMIVNDLVPAFGEFVRALAPVVAWLVNVLAPIVKAVFSGILDAIKGALNIIIGIIKVFTGILTGDWSKAWAGVKQILKGALQIIWAIIRTGVAIIGSIFRTLIGLLGKIVAAIGRAIVNGFKRAMSNAASAIRSGASKARSAAAAVKNAVVGIFRGAGGWLLSAGRAILDGLINGVKAAVGRLKSTLGGITHLIPSWKGPMSVDLKLLEPTGRAIMHSLTAGFQHAVPDVRKSLQGVTAEVPDFAAPRGVAQAATRGGEPARLLIDTRGSRLDALLVEVLRQAVKDKGGDVQKVLGSK